MIAKITGQVSHIHQSGLVIQVAGIGFLVYVPQKTLQSYSKKADKISLFTYTYLREDNISLYGFEKQEELNLFEKIITISGIGAKTGLAILSAGSSRQIAKAVVDSDVSFFTNIKGIGKKSAQRLIIDLKSSLGDSQEFDFDSAQTPAFDEAIQALRQFGFSSKESREAIKNIKNANQLSSEELLKAVLKSLGK